MPLYVEIDNHTPMISCTVDTCITPRVRAFWSGASVGDITKSKQYVDLYLDYIYVPVESLLCKYYNCVNSFLFVHLIECIMSATKKRIPFSNCITKPVRMSGYNIDISIAHEKYLFWHGLWILCGKPETGQVARIMRFTCNNYKIRKMKNESRSRAKQSLANALVNNRTRDLCSYMYVSEIKKINKSTIVPISIVNGEYAHKDIANLFSCQYKSLYSNVTSDLSELSHMYDSIKAGITNLYFLIIIHVDHFMIILCIILM